MGEGHKVEKLVGALFVIRWPKVGHHHIQNPGAQAPGPGPGPRARGSDPGAGAREIPLGLLGGIYTN